MAPSMVSLWIVSFLVAVCKAAPTVSFPVNSQVPPIARIGEAFEFTFSPTTFSSASPMTYSLSDPPRWLSIDSGARRLFGTPEEIDIDAEKVIGVPITLVATDDSGSVSSPATLVVSRNPAPAVQVPPAEQVPKFGEPFSQPASVLSYPDKSFDYAFSPSTFSRPDLNYYAVSGDNTPLPAWISFDPSRLGFRGRTPPLGSLINPPQSFEFKLMASDVVGFSAVSLSFFVVVGEHQLITVETSLAINVTIGSAVSDKTLKGMIKLDGKDAEPNDIKMAETPNMPSWLSFNKENWEFQGTPPAGSRSTSFPLLLEDEHGDSLNLTVKVNFATALFRSSLTELRIKPGSRFSFDLKPHLLDPTTTEIDLETDPATSWVRYDTAAMTLSGEAPRYQAVSAVDLVLNAKSRNSEATDERTLRISIEDATEAASPTSLATASTLSADKQPTSAGATPLIMPSQSNLPTAANDSKEGGLSLGTVLLAVLLPVTLLGIALLFMFLAWQRRRRRRSRTLNRKDISGPLPGSFMQVGMPEDSPIREMGKRFDVGHNDSPTKNGAPGGRDFSAESRLSLYAFPAPPPQTVPSVSGSVFGTMNNSLNGRKNAGSGWKTPRIFAAARSKARRARSKSYLSDTSVYVDPAPFDVSTMPLPPRLRGSAGAAGSFRSNVEFGIPTLQPYDASIQQTPESLKGDGIAGSTKSGGTVRRHYLPSANSEGSDTSLDLSPVDPATLPLPRPDAKSSHGLNIDGYNQDQDGKGGGGVADYISKLGSKKSMGSMTTVDTFKDKAAAARERHAGDHADGGIINRPRPGALSGLPSSLPHGGRSQSTGRHGGFPCSNTAKPPVISISCHQPVFKDEIEGEWTPAMPDPAGISYEDIANSSPFKSSTTWSTFKSTDGYFASTGQGHTQSSHNPNWTVLKNDNDSPVINQWVQRDGDRRDGRGKAKAAKGGAAASGLGISIHEDNHSDTSAPRHPPADRSWDVGLGLSSLWKSSKRQEGRGQLSEVALNNSSSPSPSVQERAAKYTSSRYSVLGRWDATEENKNQALAGGGAGGSNGPKRSRGSNSGSAEDDYRVFV